MWIKTPKGNLINTENISFIGLDWQGTTIYIEGHVCGTFKSKAEAQAYLDKLAEKLGAKELDKE